MMRMRLGIGMCCALTVLPGCFLNSGGVDRRSGQIELFQIEPVGQQLCRPFDPGRGLTAPTERRDLTQNWGDRLRYGSDSVTIQVHAINLERLPTTVTGSKDVIVFAEVWENAAAAYDSKPITSIVYIGKNQLVPGIMNFNGALAFGPTSFKGTPMKVRFTVMILQKERGQQQAELAEVIGKYASLVPVYGVIASEVVGVIRDMLRAQADVIAFDYDATLLSDNPAPNLTNETNSTGSRGANKAPEAERGKAWANFDQRIGWLQYGFFALVETRGRHVETVYPFDGESNAAASTRRSATWRGGSICAPRRSFAPPAPTGEPAGPGGTDGAGRVAAGGAHGGTPEPAELSEPPMDPLKTNYLVFSVTPGQIPQDGDFLRVASDANLALLSDLRQTPENVTMSLESIRQRATELKGGVVESRLKATANRLATQKFQTPTNFGRLFDAESTRLIEEAVNSEPPGDDRTKLDALLKAAQERLLNRYKSDLLSLNTAAGDRQLNDLQDTYTRLSGEEALLAEKVQLASVAMEKLTIAAAEANADLAQQLGPGRALGDELLGAMRVADAGIAAAIKARNEASAGPAEGDGAAAPGERARTATAEAAGRLADVEQKLAQLRPHLEAISALADSLPARQSAIADLRAELSRRIAEIRVRTESLQPQASALSVEVGKAADRALDGVKSEVTAASSVEMLRQSFELKEDVTGQAGLLSKLTAHQAALDRLTEEYNKAQGPSSDIMLSVIQVARELRSRADAAEKQIQTGDELLKAP